MHFGGEFTWPVVSRFHHGLGAARLMRHTYENNPELTDHQQQLLMASALLHDAGNSPFSHNGERVLRALTGKDGETFLENVLKGSDAERVLKRHGITVDEVVGMVTGTLLPLAPVLCGSLDVDNVDNVNRYIQIARLPISHYSPMALVSGFSYYENQWVLREHIVLQVSQWLHARWALYRFLYESQHMCPDAMLDRALWFAYERSEIGHRFFGLTDEGALDYLEQCNSTTQDLVWRIRHWDWYERILNLHLKTDVPAKVIQYTGEWKLNHQLANEMSKTIYMRSDHICIIAVASRERRGITLPFINSEGVVVDVSDIIPSHVEPTYRVQMFVPPELDPIKKSQLIAMAQEYFEIEAEE